jgi:uncharacterized protein YdhG (YjbR/CyaY superfamily)
VTASDEIGELHVAAAAAPAERAADGRRHTCQRSLQRFSSARRHSMKSSTPKNIDRYIAGFPTDVRPTLERVRNTIRKALPRAEEAIAYGIPAFKVNGRTIIYFAGWKQHYSIYPANDRLVAAFKDVLKPYEVNGKGTIRFPLSQPVPVKLIASLAKFRAKEAANRASERVARQ